MTKDEEIELIRLLEAEQEHARYNKLGLYYPSEGTLSRTAYPKHMEFFAAGTTHLERAAIAANRVGKTTLSAFETSLHLTGRYPDWWNGRRFDCPVEWWAASDTSETTRDILQLELLGKLHELGTGMIPRDCIVGDPTRRRGVADAVDTVQVRHASGGISTLSFKSYDQGREKFQGTKKHGISLDEEPKIDVYTECLTRLMATKPGDTDGTMICTFTPLQGMSTVVLSFLNEPNPNRFVLTMGWEDAPHLSEESKAKLLASYPPHERDARSKGIPRLGSGAIYPVPESEILVADFEIPDHWPRMFGMDVGWNRTACVWGALDRTSDTIYLYAEHYRGQAEPAIHAASIRARGEWIPGVIDPASRGRSQVDGMQLLQMYKDLGLDLDVASNAVESGLYEVWTRLSTGRIKVFKSMGKWIEEFRLYRRDDKGRIVKENDHVMDATRYLAVSGPARAKTKPAPRDESKRPVFERSNGLGWMG
jgi:phage terminase large subunit-like protein